MNMNSMEKAKEIVLSVFSNLPHYMHITKDGGRPCYDRAFDPEDAIIVDETNKFMLTVRLEREFFHVIYQSLLEEKRFHTEPIRYHDFDQTEMVADFSRKFGWVEHIQTDHDRVDKDIADRLCQSVEWAKPILENAPSVLYLKNRFSRKETKGSSPFFLNVDIHVNNEGVVGAFALYMSNDEMDPYDYDPSNKSREWNHIMTESGGISSTEFCLAFNDFQPLNARDIEDLLFFVFNIAPIRKGPNKKNRSLNGGPFSMSFRGDMDHYSPVDCGISKERVREFVREFVESNDPPNRKFERLCSMCSNKDELFFIGWLRGNVEARLKIEAATGIDMGPVFNP